MDAVRGDVILFNKRLTETIVSENFERLTWAKATIKSIKSIKSMQSQNKLRYDRVEVPRWQQNWQGTEAVSSGPTNGDGGVIQSIKMGHETQIKVLQCDFESVQGHERFPCQKESVQ